MEQLALFDDVFYVTAFDSNGDVIDEVGLTGCCFESEAYAWAVTRFPEAHGFAIC